MAWSCSWMGGETDKIMLTGCVSAQRRAKGMQTECVAFGLLQYALHALTARCPLAW